MLKRYFRRSSWRQQPVTLRATHRSVISPLAAVPLAVLAAASSPGSLAMILAEELVAVGAHWASLEFPRSMRWIATKRRRLCADGATDREDC